MSGVYHMYERASIDPKALSDDLLKKLCAPTPSDRDEIQQVMRSLSVQALSDLTAGYHFDFYTNPNATRPAPWLPKGVLPYRFSAR